MLIKRAPGWSPETSEKFNLALGRIDGIAEMLPEAKNELLQATREIDEFWQEMTMHKNSMLGLTLTEPWATLCVLGIKRIETRRWRPSPDSLRLLENQALAIHAANDISDKAWDFINHNPYYQRLAPQIPELQPGHIVGTVEIAGFLPTDFITLRTKTARKYVTERFGFAPSQQEISFGDFKANRWGWLLKNARRLKNPMTAKGALTFFNLSAEQERELMEAQYYAE